MKKITYTVKQQRRRERALERFTLNGSQDVDYLARKRQEYDALTARVTSSVR